MNAAVLADGHAAGGPEGARAALEDFWRRVSDAALLSPLPAQPARRAARPLDARQFAGVHRDGPDVAAVLALRPRPGRRQSAARHPGRDASTSSGWRAAPIKLFVTATNVRTGRGRVFRNAEITPDVLLASACLPTHVPGDRDRRRALLGRRLFRQSDDHAAGARMRVAATPSWCRSTRSSGRARRARARDILNRLNEVSFNAVLLKELRMIALLRQVADPGRRRGRALGRHAHPPHRQRRHGRARLFLEAQRRMGVSVHAARRGPPRAPRRSCDAHGDDLGRRSTLDLDVLLEGV